MNLATLLDGPANVTHRGATFHFRGGLTLTPLTELLRITADSYGTLGLRALDNTFALTGTPVGVWTAAQLAVLYRWANPKIGQLVTPRYDIDTVTAATNIITLLGTAVPRTGCPVRVSPFPASVLPAGIVAATTYYWGAAGTLHATEADALAATGPIDITDAGTGDFALIEQETILIECPTINRRITFHNGAIIGMPPAILSAVASAFGAATFACFRKNDAPWSEANSVYTVAKALIADTPPAIADIPTQEYTAVFGAAPWDSFKSRGPITITPTLSTQPTDNDGRGTVGLQISDLNVSATLQPQDRSHAQMLDLLAIQGGTAARGATKVRSDLVVSGTGVHCTLYNGAPRELPQTFQATGPLAGALAIDGHATAGSARFRFAIAAP